MVDIEEAFELACLLRGTIKRFSDSPALAALRDNGEEAEATAHAWILAQYLKSMGCKKIRIAHAVERDQDGRDVEYVWVETDGLTIDPNAHRLPGSSTLLIISQYSVFHSLFKNVKRTALSQKALEERQMYVMAYEALLQKNPVLRNHPGETGRPPGPPAS